MTLRRRVACSLALPLAVFACSSDEVEPSLPPPEAAGGAAGGTGATAGGAGATNASAIDTTASLDGGTSESSLDADVLRDPNPNADGDASTDASSPTYAPDWCARAGADDLSRTNTFFLVALTYVDTQSTDCTTEGLTSSLDPQQVNDWFGYLVDYSFAMAGCSPDTVPLDGGILVFGPGNTPVVGAVRPDLGADDVVRLTTHYVAAFGDALSLDEGERAEVRDHLLLTAQADIDPAASEALSTCGNSADAGL